jgi:hypothetical protein
MAITPVFICGAECAIDAVGTAGGTGGVNHWNTLTGTVTVDTGTFRAPGIRSYKVTSAAGAANYWQKTITGSPTRMVLRFYVNFSALPSADCSIASCRASAGSWPFVFFKQSDSKIYASIAASTPTLGATGVTVTTGTWYRIDFLGDVNGATRTCDVKVDGTACGQASSAIAASFFTAFQIGANVDTTTANHTHFIDDIVCSTTLADFPIGAGVVDGLYPNADGTHNFSANTDFADQAGTGIAVGATNVWTHLKTNLNTTIGNYLRVPGAANTEYVEIAFDDLGTDVNIVHGMEVVVAMHAEGTGANKETLRLNDNGTLSDVLTDLDYSNVTIGYHTKQYVNAPSTSAAWTKTLVDGVKARWNSSYGTVDESAVPDLDGICLEVAYLQTVAGAKIGAFVNATKTIFGGIG